MKVLQQGLDGLDASEPFDLLVVGAGGAGLACALLAALDGARVLLVERTGLVGGTTALSAGTTWVPGNAHSAEVNPGDTLDQARSYLDHAVGEHSPRALREAFLAHGRRAIETLEARTDVRFRPYPRHPDYLSDLPGSTLCGRALEPLPFDGRQLGALFGLLRPPIPEFTVLGGMMVDRTDIGHLLGVRRSLTSLRHSVRLLARHALDRLRHPRGTRLVMGNALVGRLLLSLSRQAGVTLALNTSLDGIERDAHGVVGATLRHQGQTRPVRLRGGLVLASGGFNRHPQWRERLLPGIPPAWSPGAPGHTGEAQALTLALGAHHGTAAKSHAFWAPCSLRQRADGSRAVFPHFVMDRAKPGMITVNQRGERFLNESTSYHQFGLAMQAAHAQTPSIPAWLVCDADALRAYGIGMVRPGGRGLAPFLADGYLRQGATLAELATQLGMDAGCLQASVAQNNAAALAGHDAAFGRGVTAYQQNLGDPARAGAGGNPNLGPLQTAPFYAVQLYPGDIGAATGLVTDAQARVLDGGHQPIAGLYAIGNDMQSIMGGAYPAPGITIGPGLVFAHLASRDAVSRAQRAGTPD
ncbi:MAG: FAD-dependent oxidoreductase [Rhodoferax sp.]|nr:FAD-dependent oxidoreductase [Rhodoferax sp.]